MFQKNLSISLVFDFWNHGSAANFALFIRQTKFLLSNIRRISLDDVAPHRLAGQLRASDVILAFAGIPGRHDYEDSLHPLLSAFAQNSESATLVIVSHTTDLTASCIRVWQERNPLLPIPHGRLLMVDQQDIARLANLTSLLELCASKNAGRKTRENKMTFVGPMQIAARHFVPAGRFSLAH